MNDVQERVARGAAWLDENRPGWRDAISLQELDMRSGCDCVLGQVYATDAIDGDGYHYVLRKLIGSEIHYAWAAERGFTLVYSEERELTWLFDWNELEEEWRRVISLGAPRKQEALA